MKFKVITLSDLDLDKDEAEDLNAEDSSENRRSDMNVCSYVYQ